MINNNIQSMINKIIEYKWVIFSVITSLMIGFYIGQLKQIGSSAIIGFSGVIIGVLITSFISFYNSKREREQNFNTLVYEKQINAHQLAYKKMDEIRKYIYGNKNELYKKVTEMQDFLAEYCLFIDPEIEDALRVAKNCATSHEDFLEPPRDNNLIVKNWLDIHKPFNLIRVKIQLPSIPIPKDPQKLRSIVM